MCFALPGVSTRSDGKKMKGVSVALDFLSLQQMKVDTLRISF